jgi:hypothetical protein
LQICQNFYKHQKCSWDRWYEALFSLGILCVWNPVEVQACQTYAPDLYESPVGFENLTDTYNLLLVSMYEKITRGSMRLVMLSEVPEIRKILEEGSPELDFNYAYIIGYDAI